MNKKTEGIVLRTLKHQDANLITTVYTREFGIKSFIIKGYRSTRARKRHSYFQPMSIIDIVFFEKENRGIQKITESKLAHHLNEIQAHPTKLSLGLAIVEIFYDTVKEEEQNYPIYDLLRSAILMLDQSPRRLIQIFIYYLLHHTRQLGFFPNDMSEGSNLVSFDTKSGIFRAASNDADLIAHFLRRFVYSQLIPLPDPYSCQQITFDSNIKKFLIKTLFEYYESHIEGFKYPQTMKVFAEVFGGIQ